MRCSWSRCILAFAFGPIPGSQCGCLQIATRAACPKGVGALGVDGVTGHGFVSVQGNHYKIQSISIIVMPYPAESGLE